MEGWIAANNPKAQIYLPVPDVPQYDENTEKVEWRQGWQIIPLTNDEIAAKTRKVWRTKNEFWNEFSPSEQLAVMDSTVPEIRLLDRQLLIWPGEVWGDDERVINGLNALVAVGILTIERKEEILSK